MTKINEEGEQVSQPSGSITSTIQRLKKQLSADRLGYVKAAKVEEIKTPDSLRDVCEAKPDVSGSKDGPKISSRRKGSCTTGVRRAKNLQTESACSSEKPVTESSCGEFDAGKEQSEFHHSGSPQKGKRGGRHAGIPKKNNKRTAERVLVCIRKRQKKMVASDTDSIASGAVSPPDINLRSNSRRAETNTSRASQKKYNRIPTSKKLLRKRNSAIKDDNNDEDIKPGEKVGDETKTGIQVIATKKEGEVAVCEKDAKVVTGAKNDDSGWSAIEKGLYAKGVEIFGRNRCSKGCKNRFRGCHCAKSQCRSRQCPCFAAGRECDPDVCRNCWVGCGDGTLGGPPQRGDNYECRNMKLLLKQQQRVLLGRSDVSGWGAFLKNSVNKHDYLGEYTGESISHREADKRGKIYDRENSSFLFNLNDQYVLDAYRKGDKLKFANHSPTPNCYAKVIMVAGDHRVGIFAKERIAAGEELFYDYRYEPDRAPIWARKPEGSNSKRDETSSSHGRAQKVA